MLDNTPPPLRPEPGMRVPAPEVKADVVITSPKALMAVEATVCVAETVQVLPLPARITVPAVAPVPEIVWPMAKAPVTVPPTVKVVPLIDEAVEVATAGIEAVNVAVLGSVAR